MPNLIQLDTEPQQINAPQWREFTAIFRVPRGAVHALDAWRYGTLAVHCTWGDDGARPFTATHWPSRLVVFRSGDPQQAARDAERLWAACPRAWAGEAVDLAALPADVLQWLRENQR